MLPVVPIQKVPSAALSAFERSKQYPNKLTSSYVTRIWEIAFYWNHGFSLLED